MHRKQVIYSGKDINDSERALIMLHGRGADARDILGLAGHLSTDDFAIVAPDATNHTWYPYSFMSEPAANEPWLSSALLLVSDIVDDLRAASIREENIYLLGFSQGACLTLEFAARNATRFGGIITFTGGLIGDRIYTENYKGDFQNTPVFIGSSDPDPHVPVSRVNETAALLEKMNAQVTKKIYKNMGHTINQEELEMANKLLQVKK